MSIRTSPAVTQVLSLTSADLCVSPVGSSVNALPYDSDLFAENPLGVAQAARMNRIIRVFRMLSEPPRHCLGYDLSNDSRRMDGRSHVSASAYVLLIKLFEKRR